MYNGAWTDGSEICNITLKSLTVKRMWHLSKTEKQTRCEFKSNKEEKYAKEIRNLNLQYLVQRVAHIGL